jgi:hypothetical protein
MRSAAALALVVVGGLVILGPVAAHAYLDNRDKERIAEFYSRNGSAIVLPNDLHPTAYGPYEFGCWAAGVGMALAGVLQARSAPAPTRA